MIRKKIAKMLFLGIIHFRLISKNGGGSDLVIIVFAGIAVNGTVMIGNRARSCIQKHVRCVEEKGHSTNLSRNKTTVAKIHIQYWAIAVFLHLLYSWDVKQFQEEDILLGLCIGWVQRLFALSNQVFLLCGFLIMKQHIPLLFSRDFLSKVMFNLSKYAKYVSSEKPFMALLLH